MQEKFDRSSKLSSKVARFTGAEVRTRPVRQKSTTAVRTSWHSESSETDGFASNMTNGARNHASGVTVLSLINTSRGRARVAGIAVSAAAPTLPLRGARGMFCVGNITETETFPSRIREKGVPAFWGKFNRMHITLKPDRFKSGATVYTPLIFSSQHLARDPGKLIHF